MPLNEQITSLPTRKQQPVTVKSSRIHVGPLFDELTIAFERQDDGSYRLWATSSLGEVEEQPFQLPFAEEEVAFLLQQLADSGHHERRRLRRNGPEMVVDVGMRLFYALFEGMIGSHGEQLFLQARQQGRSVRIRLLMASPELASLPWELLYDESRADFVGLSIYSPLVRQWGKPLVPALGRIELPLRLLVIKADVYSQGESSQEIEMLRQLQAEFSEIFEMKVVSDANRQAFLNALENHSYHILLFIGNGHPLSSDNDPHDASSSEAQALALMLEGADCSESAQPPKSARTWELLYAKELIERLRDNKMLRLLHLNGPHTDWLARELTQVAPATIGIRGAVTETAYQAFSQAFYRALLACHTLERAVTSGRQKMDHHRAGTREWSHVVFYQQSEEGALLPDGASHACHVPSGVERTRISEPKNEAQELLGLHLAIYQRNLEVLNERCTLYKNAIPDFLLRQRQQLEEKIARMAGGMYE